MTMATAFAVSAEPDIEFVSSGAKKRGFNESCDDYNPFDAYSPSEHLCPEKVSLSDWSQWASPSDRNPFITLHGNMNSPRKSHQSSELDAASFQCVDCDDERPVFNDRLVPIPDGTPSEIVNSMKEVCSARLSHLRHVLQSVATAHLTICEIFGVATDARHVHPNLTEIQKTHNLNTSIRLKPRQFLLSCARWLADDRVEVVSNGTTDWRRPNRLQTQVTSVPGKTLNEPETRQSVQRDRDMHSVRLDAELLVERVLHKKASRCSSMSSKSVVDFKSPEQNRREWCPWKR